MKTVTIKVYGRVDPKQEEKRHRELAAHQFLGKPGVRKIRYPFASLEVEVSPKRALTDGRSMELERRYGT